MHSGIYIFEGIDNVGKTTIICELKKLIQETTDYKCLDIAFPGKEPRTLGNLVYHIHHNEEQYFDVPLNEISLQLLHVASHIDLIQRQLRKLNNQRCIVLLDRFWWSTYAYGIAGGVGEEVIKSIIAPELVFWKDLNVKKIFLIERNNRQKEYGLNKDDVILDKYRRLSENEPMCTKLSNNSSINDGVKKVYQIIFGENVL